VVRIHPPQYYNVLCDNTLCNEGLGYSPRPSLLNNHQIITVKSPWGCGGACGLGLLGRVSSFV
jgi:hypothetical protein